MHHNLTLLINIGVVFVTAFFGGYLARRLKLPTMVGYLLAGVAIGPFTPGFVGDVGDISQLAELGVIFMLFGVGLHFSLRDLWNVRSVAIPGAVLQILLATGVGLGLTQLWGWSIGAGLALGLAISVASTVVLLRGLSDNGYLHTSHGQVAIGWLILEDLATVAILVLLPAMVGSGEGGNPLFSAARAIFLTVIFVALMLFLGAKVLPWMLTRIAHTRSRELFILAVVAVALGTALGAAVLFNVSLALGAFLAGVVISESEVSHQVGAEVLPFRDIFAAVFFASVGMLVNPLSLLSNVGQVIAVILLIVLGKGIITILLGLVLPASARTMLVVAAGLSQIGEFSFIVGTASVTLGLMTQEQYGLILAGALVSIILNPFMFRLIGPVEAALQRIPALWKRLNRAGVAPEAGDDHGLSGHVVVVGYGRVGEHIISVLEQLKVPYLVVERDAVSAAEYQMRGIPTLFGDAANSEILTHVGLDKARALVVTVPDETAAELIVAGARDLAPSLPIIARAATPEGVRRLDQHGARDVIHPELEGGLEIVRHTLIRLNYPVGQVQGYIDAVRRDAYDTTVINIEERRMLDQLVSAARGMEIAWRKLEPGSPLIGQTLGEADLRARVGASVIAVVRNQQVVANPKSNVAFAEGDIIGLLGDAEQVAAAERFIQAEPVENQPA